MRKRRMRIAPAVGSLFVIVVASFSAVANAGVGVWTSGGPYGGDIRALAINPANSATLYAGTFGGGIFKSTNSGATWAATNTGLTNANVRALVIDPSTPTTLFVGTDGGGVFKSTDSGGTWASANTGLSNANVRTLAINPLTPTTLFAGTDGGGVFKSTNAGGTWTTSSTGLTARHITALVISPLTPSTIFAASFDGPYSTSGVFRSTDSGGTWAAVWTRTDIDMEALAINPTAVATLYSGSNFGVLKSTNSGGTWLDTSLSTPCGSGSDRCGVYVYALAINPATPTTLYAGGYYYEGKAGVFKSTDSGGTWTAVSTGLTYAGINVLAIDPSTPATLYAGTNGGGVFKSTDAGGTWAATNTGLTSSNVHGLTMSPSTPTTVFAGTDGGGIFKSTDSGGTWAATNTGLTSPYVNALAINPATPSTLYAGTNGGVFKTTDSGVTWAAASTGLTIPGYGVYVLALAIDPVKPSTLYAGTSGYGVFKSTDSGGTWTAAAIGLPYASFVLALAIDPTNPSTLYAGTTRHGVFKSTDSGGTWTPANAQFSYRDVYAVVIDPAAPATLYAGTNEGILKSIDSGGTWATADAGLPAIPFVYALAINTAAPATLYAATDSGVLKSTDSGGTWLAVSAGLPNVPVNALALNPTGVTTLYAGLEGGGVWQATPPPYGSNRSAAFVPIVLDVTGLAHYTSELQLTNLGASPATVKLSYTSSIGSGTGDVQETIPAGQQVVYPDAISYLRFRGVPIPASGNQGGTLLVFAPAGGVHATVRTGSDTTAPQPAGRAGLAYIDTDPTVSSSPSKKYVYGLRTNDVDRSNLAVYNMGAGPVSLKITLVSGDDGRSFEVTAGVPLVLPAYGWYQYSGILNAAGFSSGYAIIERVSTSGPFGAYGVVNDQLTNDGSFISAFSGAQSGSRLTIPVLVETSAFESELILTNRASAALRFTLAYSESLSPAKDPGGYTTVDVGAGRQMIIPRAIDFLRSKGISIGARGEAGYAGSLGVELRRVGDDGVLEPVASVFVGARTSSLSPAGGEFGLFYPAIDSSQEFSVLAFILGLKSDVNNRSNVAVLHTGHGGPITLELQVMDGSEGGKAVGQPLSVTLNPGQWAQPPGFFASGGVPNGYVRIRRTAGTAPWYAYGVINDGGQPGQRTGDGSYVPGVQP